MAMSTEVCAALRTNMSSVGLPKTSKAGSPAAHLYLASAFLTHRCRCRFH